MNKKFNLALKIQSLKNYLQWKIKRVLKRTQAVIKNSSEKVNGFKVTVISDKAGELTATFGSVTRK